MRINIVCANFEYQITNRATLHKRSPLPRLPLLPLPPAMNFCPTSGGGKICATPAANPRNPRSRFNWTTLYRMRVHRDTQPECTASSGLSLPFFSFFFFFFCSPDKPGRDCFMRATPPFRCFGGGGHLHTWSAARQTDRTNWQWRIVCTSLRTYRYPAVCPWIPLQPSRADHSSRIFY